MQASRTGQGRKAQVHRKCQDSCPHWWQTVPPIRLGWLLHSFGSSYASSKWSLQQRHQISLTPPIFACSYMLKYSLFPPSINDWTPYLSNVSPSLTSFQDLSDLNAYEIFRVFGWSLVQDSLLLRSQGFPKFLVAFPSQQHLTWDPATIRPAASFLLRIMAKAVNFFQYTHFLKSYWYDRHKNAQLVCGNIQAVCTLHRDSSQPKLQWRTRSLKPWAAGFGRRQILEKG